MSDSATELLRERTQRLEEILGRSLDLPTATDHDGDPLTNEKRRYLLEEAEELFWNELEWENLTAEERLDEGALTELAFPGFLALVRGLLLEEALPDAGIDAVPRPDVVRQILRFLAERALEFEEELSQGAEDEVATGAAKIMTQRLIDLVLIRLHDLRGEEEERAASALEPD